MPLFACEGCGGTENTAVSGYWTRPQVRQGQVLVFQGPALCVKCQTGTWHGLFEQQNAAATGYHLGEDGFLYRPEHPPTHTTLRGPVPPVPAQET